MMISRVKTHWLNIRNKLLCEVITIFEGIGGREVASHGDKR
jgi:hypothetical protein